MIRLEHIRKCYGKKIVLKDITFQAKAGERIAIVGKNGCGKSTLLQVMAGIIKPSGGSIHYFGRNAKDSNLVFSKLCGYVPQENPLIEELSVKDNLRLWGSKKSQNYKEIVSQFNLEEILKTPVERLSGGMKRRLSIACAIIQHPPIVLMDEPTTAIDIHYKNVIREWMRDYQKDQGILVITTHDEKEILDSDRCLVMNEGKMLELVGENICMEVISKYI